MFDTAKPDCVGSPVLSCFSDIRREDIKYGAKIFLKAEQIFCSCGKI